MAHEIIWTEIATEDFDQIISFISEGYSEEQAIAFVQTFYRRLDLLATMPFIGTKSQKRENVRRLLINKNYSLAYTVIVDQIYLLRVIVNRQDPDKSEF